MNKIKKIICLVLSLAMILLIVSSCNKPDDEKEKFVVATYDKGKVYSDQITNWVNFLYTRQYSEIEAGTVTKQEIAKQAIETLLLNIFLDEELTKINKNISNEDLDMLVSNEILELNEQFKSTDSATGKTYVGYEGWKEAYNVSDDFLKEVIKFMQQEQIYGKYLVETADIPDEELKAYYDLHAIDYAQEAGHRFNFALVEVKDMQNEEELSEAKNIAQEYINKLNNKTITFEDVVKEVKENYTQEKGYSGMSFNISAVGDFVADTTFDTYVQIYDLEGYIGVIEEAYKDIMDKDADKDSQEYENYLRYLFELYKAKAYYTMKQRNVGVFAEPIEYPDGYVVFEYVEHQSAGWGSFEENKEKIKEDYLNSSVTYSLTKYEASLLDKHNVEIQDFTVE